MKKQWFTFCLLLSSLALQAQNLPKGEAKYYYHLNEPLRLMAIDTNIQNYEEYSSEYQEDWEYFNSSTLGSAQQKIAFEWNAKKGFQDGNVFFKNYQFYLPEQKRYIVEKYPYSEAFYRIGTQFEQIAHLVHAQKIKNSFDFGINAKGFSSNGIYSQSQKIRNVALSFYGNFYTKNQRYKVGASLSYNNIRTREIGGVVENVLSEAKSNKLFYTTYLNDATYKSNLFSVNVENEYRFGIQQTDSINDSTEIKHFYPTFSLNYSIGTNIYGQNFMDKSPNDTFYQAFYQGEDSLVYQLNYHNLPHRLALKYEWAQAKEDTVLYKNLQAEVALQHNNIEIRQSWYEATYNNLMLEATLSSHFKANSPLKYKLNTAYFFTGYNKNDFSLNAMASYHFKKYGIIETGLRFEKVSPFWIENYYISPSVQWQNNFNKKQLFQTHFEYRLPKHQLKFRFELDLLDQYIYFNESQKPIQSNAKITYWNMSVNKKTHWKIWHWDNFIGYQFTNHKSILPLPSLFLKTSLYSQFYTFKRNLLLLIGFDLRYNTPFYARGWNPVTAQFYTQKEQEMKYTPVVDVFVNAHIKSLRFYAKMNFVNEGLFVRTNYKALNFPSNGRSFSIGLSWRFFE